MLTSPHSLVMTSTLVVTFILLLICNTHSTPILPEIVRPLLGSHAASSSGETLDLGHQLSKIKSTGPLKVTCLTIGSRGDVQPYIALCKGLQRAGNTCTIATHPEFKDWIEAYGIKFASIGGSPKELMKHCVEHGIFSISFWKEGYSKFSNWYKNLLESSYKAASDADLLIESPSAMVGTHVAESLRIPYFRAFTMPWTQTYKYPHAFVPQSWRWVPGYNSWSYRLFDFAVWVGISKHVNSWRKGKNLERIGYSSLRKRKYPFLYNFSPEVVPKPKDWGKWTTVTGYWVLHDKPAVSENLPSEAEVPQGLDQFIQKARAEGKKIVYIGFGSVVVPDAKKMTQTISDAVKDADVHAVLSGGWSDRGSDSAEAAAEAMEEQKKLLGGNIFYVKSVPHDWLFPRVDAAVHHGGAGSTGASMSAGIPTVIKPFFGDQNFWAARVEALGVGTHLKVLEAKPLSKALKDATRNHKKIEKAKAIGAKLREEDGVGNAIEAIYKHINHSRRISYLNSQEPRWSKTGLPKLLHKSGQVANNIFIYPFVWIYVHVKVLLKT
ncbi:family 1 glycosyltransferase [Melampsora americana]|nr:family 1 glycosyltransferase [Melampsora americana]